jgi:GTP 3',8-cyclase
MNLLPILDRFGRVHDSLRISVTDRCNIRCFYCMPEQVEFLPRKELLTFEEIERLVRVAAALGVTKIRLTGGEPLVRSQLWKLIQQIVAVPGIKDVALTTNGILLAEQAPQLLQAGLKRLNVSLDALNPEVFERITRRKGLDQVLNGISTAQKVGFRNIRINAVSIKNLTESEIVPLAKFAREKGLILRFIEFMPLDADRKWNLEQVLTGGQVIDLLQQNIGPLEPDIRLNYQQPAMDYKFCDGHGRVGFINSVSEPFCQNCNRMRLTAEGKLRNCLFATEEWDLRELLRSGASEEALEHRIRQCILEKKSGHGMDADGFEPPARPMFQIGG